MPTSAQNVQVQRASTGWVTTRAAEALPSTTIKSLFTATGKVMIKAVYGQVVTVLSGTNSTTIGITPIATSTSAPAILSSAGIIALAVGAPFVSKLDGGAMIVTVTGSLMAASPYIMVAGDITCTTASTVTGTVTWGCVWVPLDVGSNLVAS